ncbi:stage II sporulation protein M [Jeotgalibacillus sp. HH7-29]|uniref:Stage II sporulation protein M n=2 Tax=Jeotgalibacillus haloalkalitolerans TaxID=3104292 RepID=A0ABU5KLC3_9BACL|nr:stage II sporulation protein M [Jeotgalibacillus sp. HH7-29]
MAYYIFILILLAGGTAAGALLVNIYAPLHIIPDIQFGGSGQIFSAMLIDLFILLFIWTSGFTLAGLPVAWFLIYMKGCLFGFASGMMLYEKGMGGILEAAIVLLPHNLLIMSVYIILGAESLILAGQIWKGIGARQPFIYTIKSIGTAYLVLLGVSLAAAGVAGLVEYYVPGFLIRIFIT